MPSASLFLIAFIGPVGSGKTHIARILAEKLHGVYINTDAIRVKLRRQGKPMFRAVATANRTHRDALARGRSVIADFDAVLPRRQRELKQLARRFGAKFFLIRIRAPESLLLERLREKRYTKGDLFRNAREALRVYFIRRKFHRRRLQTRPDFVINNARPLRPQIQKIIKKLR